MFWVCVCSLSYLAERMLLIILSSVACPALNYSSTLPHKQHDFLKKKVPEYKCFDFLYNLCLKHFSL